MKNENDKLLDQELKEATRVLNKYMSEDDSSKFTFHLLNIMRLIKN